MLVGLHVPTNIQMYRQKSGKALWGGGGAIAPPPPLATLMIIHLMEMNNGWKPTSFSTLYQAHLKQKFAFVKKKRKCDEITKSTL